MGWQGSEMKGCKKHPKHKQSPGVCSMCLREKLSHLSSTKTSTSSTSATYVFNVSSSVSSSISSTVSSSCSSPTFRGGDHVKHGPVSVLVSGGNGLQRSRSMAFVEARKRVDYGGIHGDVVKEKKRGFWSKLLGTTSKKNFDHRDPSMRYSRTMKEARVTGLLA